MGKLYNIKISGTAPYLYPTDTMLGLLWYSEEDAMEIPKQYPYQGEWGGCHSTLILLNENFPMPYKLNIIWLSIVEGKFYAIEEILPSKALEAIWELKDNIKFPYSHIIVGMAPYGNVALWFYGQKKSLLLAWLYAIDIELDIKEFNPSCDANTINEYCNIYLKETPYVRENLEKNGLPPRDLFDNYMKQFVYRYQVVYEKWDKSKELWKKYEEDEVAPEFDYIEEALYDGTHDKLRDGGLMKYHEAGKPKKLAVEWYMGGNSDAGKKRPLQEYTAYFWFEDERIRELFDKFYGAHPNTKTDFIIRIDAERNKYQVAMFRYGLKEPMVLATDVYQLIVFRNKFECYRSDNYNQPRGAWIW